MGNPPYKESIRPGDIKVFKITGSNGESVDISGSIAQFYYYESVLSNTVTATVAFVDTGFEKEGNSRIKTTGIVDSLELVGGESVEFEVVDSNDMTSESEGTITSQIGSTEGMTVKTIRDVSTSGTKKMFILDLVSKEYWINETTRVTKRYDGNPGKHVTDILENILKVTGVALLPGSDFGFNESKMLARLSFTDFDGEEFMSSIKEDQSIDFNIIEKLAPKVVEGVDNLKKWSENL